MLICICSLAWPAVGCGKSVSEVMVLPSALVRHAVLLLVLFVLLLLLSATGKIPDHAYQSGQAMKMVGNALPAVSHRATRKGTCPQNSHGEGLTR